MLNKVIEQEYSTVGNCQANSRRINCVDAYEFSGIKQALHNAGVCIPPVGNSSGQIDSWRSLETRKCENAFLGFREKFRLKDRNQNRETSIVPEVHSDTSIECISGLQWPAELSHVPGTRIFHFSRKMVS